MNLINESSLVGTVPMSNRLRIVLATAGIKTIGELAQKTEVQFLGTKWAGKQALAEARKLLAHAALRFQTDNQRYARQREIK